MGVMFSICLNFHQKIRLGMLIKKTSKLIAKSSI